MVFKIVNAYEKSKEFLVTGRFVATTDEEAELLKLMVEAFAEIQTFSGKFVANDKTVLFKSVEVKLLKQSIDFMSKNLEFPMKYVIAKNFCGSKEGLKKHWNVS